MKNTLSLICLSLTIALSSCVKDKSNGSEDAGSKKFTDIDVPVNFDWKTTVNVKCNFTSVSHTSLVKLFLPNATDAFATFYVGNGMEPVEINLPAATSEVIVKYQKEGELSTPVTLTIANGAIAYNVPADSQAIENIPVSAALKTKISKDKDVAIYYPATGMGTLMFEDLWPHYGDFDFNDFVVNYRIEMFLQNGNMVDNFFGKIRVAAIGGSLPYDLYLQLDNITGGEIRECFIRTSTNTVGDKANVVHMNTENSVHTPAILAFKDIRDNKNRPAGGMYLNTVKGYEVAAKDMVEFEFFVQLNNSVKVTDLNIEHFNFFIARPESATQSGSELIEVHCGGAAPSTYGKDVYVKLRDKSLQTNKSSQYYYSNNNIVWAINVPEVIPHIYENESFVEAYPDFIKWAQSGGTQYENWYKNRESSKVSKSF